MSSSYLLILVRQEICTLEENRYKFGTYIYLPINKKNEARKTTFAEKNPIKEKQSDILKVIKQKESLQLSKKNE